MIEKNNSLLQFTFIVTLFINIYNRERHIQQRKTWCLIDILAMFTLWQLEEILVMANE